MNIIADGLAHGHIYSMDNVCKKYDSLKHEAGLDDTPCWPHALGQRLSRHFREKIHFIRQRQANQPLLLVPSTTQTTDALAILVEKADEERTDFQLHTEPDFLHSLYVVATKIKNDVKMSVGHKGYDNLTNTAAQQCIPDSLYLLVKWMLTNVVNPLDIQENESLETTDEKQLQAILNLSQDIVFKLSKRQKALQNKDTDVLVLLVHHELTPEVWMNSSTSKNDASYQCMSSARNQIRVIVKTYLHSMLSAGVIQPVTSISLENAPVENLSRGFTAFTAAWTHI